MRKYPLVLVEWHDTMTFSTWKSEKEPEKSPLCVSVGWRLKSDRKSLVLTSMRSEGDCSSRQVIPKGCIHSIRRLDV